MTLLNEDELSLCVKLPPGCDVWPLGAMDASFKESVLPESLLEIVTDFPLS